MKKFLSLFLIISILVCTVSVPTLFASANAATDFLFVSSNCSHYTNGMTVKTLAQSGSIAAGEDVLSSYRRFYGDLNIGTSMTANFNVTAPQKPSTDTAFCQKTSTTELKRIYIHKGHSTDGGLNVDTSDYKYLTVEFDVFFPHTTSGVSFVSGGIGATGGNGGLFRANIFADSSAAEFVGNFGNTIKASQKVTYNAVGINKWHKVRIIFPFDGKTSDKLKLYIDGELKAESTDNLPLRNGMQSVYGDLYFDVDHENATYIDNFKMYAGDGNLPTYTKPLATFDDDTFALDNDDVVFTDSTATAGDVIDSVTTANIYKAVFASDLTTAKASDEAIVDGDVLVIENADGVYSYNTLKYSEPDGPQEELSTVVTTGTPLPTVENKANSWSFASSASSAVPSKAKVTFPESKRLDVSQFADGYELSFKIKHSLKGSKLLSSSQYVGQFYVGGGFSGGSTVVPSFSMFQVFSNGNGFIAPSAPVTDGMQGWYGSSKGAFTSSNRYIAGMSLDTEYTFRIVVDKKNSKLLYYIDEQPLIDATPKAAMVNYMMGLSTISGFQFAMRGGDGNEELIKVTISDMQVAEYVPEQPDDPEELENNDPFAEKLLNRKDVESGILLTGNLLPNANDADTWGTRGYFAKDIVKENQNGDEIFVGHIVRNHGITKELDLSGVSALPTDAKLYGKIKFKVQKHNTTKDNLMVLFFPYNTSTGKEGTYLVNKMVSSKTDSWKPIEIAFDIDKVSSVMNGFDTLRLCVVAGDTGTANYVEYSDYSFKDFGVYVYKESDNVNIAVNESKVINTIDDKFLGDAYEIHNSLKSYGALTSAGKFTDKYMNIVKDVNTSVVRLGGFSYNYRLWKNTIGTWAQREPYHYRSSTVSETGKMPAETAGIVEDLVLAFANGPVDIIYNINMWSAKPRDATAGERYIPTEIVTLDSSGNPKIDEEYLNASIQDAIDIIRFMTLDPSDPKAVGSDGINWAQKRVDAGFKDPINVPYWELGNEFYYRKIYDRDAQQVYDYVKGGGSEKDIGKDFSQYPEVYVTLCNRYMQEIKKVFPDVKFIAQAYDTWSGWNDVVIRSLGNKVEGLTYHMYYAYEGPSRDGDNIEAAAMHTNDCIKRLNDVVSSIEKNGYGNKLKLHLTEFGLSIYGSGYKGPDLYDSGQALHFAKMMNRLYGYKQIETAQYFMGCYLMIDVQKDDPLITSSPIRKMLNEYMTKAKGQVVETKVSADLEWHNGDVTAVAFKTDDGLRLFVTNTAGTPQNVSFEGRHTYNVKGTQTVVYDSLYNTYRESEEGMHTISTGQDNIFSGVEMPAYSTMIIELKETSVGMTSGKDAIYVSGRKSGSAETVSATLYSGTNELETVDVEVTDDGTFNFEFGRDNLAMPNLSFEIKFDGEVYDKFSVIGNGDFVMFQSIIRGEGKNITYLCTAKENADKGTLIMRMTKQDNVQNYEQQIVPFRNGAGYAFGLSKTPDIEKVFIWDNLESLIPLAEAVAVK